MNEIVPTCKQRLLTGGTLTLTSATALLLPGAAESAVAALLPELRQTTALPLPVNSASGSPAITVTVAATGGAAGGYTLAIGETVQVVGADAAGAFYGLQHLLKLLRRAADGRTVARQEVIDAPQVAVRGMMIDAGRRYWQPDTLRALIRELAWWHGNRLQLHLTEWNGFRVRLDDPRFADLATDPAYSAAEIRELIAYARSLHVEVVPELDLPAHATAIIDKRPQLRFDDADGGAVLNDGSCFTGSLTRSWTVDITRPQNREWLRELVAAFATELDPVAVHLGADEWRSDADMAGCTALSGYAYSLDPTYTATDALVYVVDELAEVVRAQGRRVEIWNWWERSSGGDFRRWPDRRTVITAWPHDPARVAWFSQAGYRVIASPSSTHYVTPRTFPGNRPDVNYVAADPEWLYRHWLPGADRANGYQLCLWSDWAEEQPDTYFLPFARRPLQAMLDGCWGGPRLSSLDEFAAAADSLTPDGTAPRDRLVGRGPRMTLDTPTQLTRLRYRVPAAGQAATIAGRWPDDVHAALDAAIGTVFTGVTPDGQRTELTRLDSQPQPGWQQIALTSPQTFTQLACDGPLDVDWYGKC